MKNKISHFSNTNRTKKCILICLESINIENDNNNFYNNSHKFNYSRKTHLYNHFNKHNVSSYNKILSLMQNILKNTIKKEDKNKIICILKYYADKKGYSNNKIKMLYSKYIDRFTYKYTKYYKYNFINKNYKQNNNINSISLIYLYLLYKTLRTNNRFYIYRNLQLQIDNLKTNFH